MLLVGVDWAEAEHAACLLDALGAVQRRLKIPHSPAGLRRLRAAIAEHEPNAAEVLVAVERSDGLLSRQSSRPSNRASWRASPTIGGRARHSMATASPSAVPRICVPDAHVCRNSPRPCERQGGSTSWMPLLLTTLHQRRRQ